MNSEIARKRINEVLRPDTMTTSKADFLATHVSLSSIELYSKFDPKDQTKTVKFEEARSEEDVLRQFIMNPGEKHQFVLVMGESGAGKSHLIRWFNERLINEEHEDEVILFVRRSDNTLKGTIKQLLDKPEVANIGNRDVYKRLVEATAVVDEAKLKGEILSKFILEVDPGEGEQESEDKIDLGYNDRRKLVAFLKYKKIQNKLMQIDGPIDRIYLKVAQSGKIASDNAALFFASDFDLDDDEMEEIEDNADKDTVKMARRLQLKPEKKGTIASYLNQFIDIVIQRCSGLESGDFEAIFKDIRREIKKDGKRLTVLIEDITSFTGVNAALLNSLTTEHTGYGNDDLCRVSSVVGITSGYLKDVFKTNYRDRVTLYVNLPNDVFNDEYLFEFIGKYLNTMSLEATSVAQWVKDGATPERYPVHTTVEGANWEQFTTDMGKKLSLYPFTKASIKNLYERRLSKTELRTPRYVLQYIVEPVVKDILYRKDSFPNLEYKILNSSASTGLRTKVFSLQDVDEQTKERLYLFAGVWGNGQDTCISVNENLKLIAGIPTDIYEELGLPVLSNLREDKVIPSEKPKSGSSKSDKTDSHTSSGEATVKKPAAGSSKEPPKTVAENLKIDRALEVLEKWVNGDSINVGATTDNVVLLSNTRDDINSYILGAINWQSEYVSQDNLALIKKSRMKNIIGFERQSSGQDLHLYLMKANRESQTIIEGFIRWAVLGNKTWDFENGDYFALAIETWTEKVKSEVVDAVSKVDGEDILYYKYAFAFEMYRQIFLGQIKSTWPEYTADMFIDNQTIDKPTGTGHSTEWAKVVDLFYAKKRETTARDIAIKYFNLVQGERGGSKIYLNRKDFDLVFEEIKTNKMVVTPPSESFKDTVAPREELRKDIYDSISSRIETVYQKELQLIEQEKVLLEPVLGTLNVSSEEILEFADCTVKFYEEVNKAQLFAKFNSELVSSVKSARSEMSNALKTIATIIEEKDMISAMVLMAQDPLKTIEPLKSLLVQLNSDIEKVDKEMKNRSDAIREQTGIAMDASYQREKETINQCEIEMKGLSGNADN